MLRKRYRNLINCRGKELESAIKKKQLEISGVDSEISKLRVELEKIKKRRKEVATGAQERQMIQMSLTRASNKYQSVKVTLRNPKDIEDEAKEQEQVLVRLTDRNIHASPKVYNNLNSLFCQILKKEIQRNLTDLSQVSEAYEKATLVRQKCELKYKVEKLGKAKLLQNKEQCMDEMSNKEVIAGHRILGSIVFYENPMTVPEIFSVDIIQGNKRTTKSSRVQVFTIEGQSQAING